MAIVQENRKNILYPSVEDKDYGTQYVKVVETNDVPTPVQVTKTTEAPKEPDTETKPAPKRGRAKKSK